MTIKKVLKFIQTNNLIPKGSSILVGLSGGADSVCLTHILYTISEALNIKLYAAHLNHGIRGSEAERDEQFAYKFADSLGIECFVKHADIKSQAKKRNISEELCGREARYKFFAELQRKFRIDLVATAHNKNDNAETILMNFMRGSSMSGLCGIPCKRDRIIRPILCLTRDEIIDYIQQNNLSFVTDSTNIQQIYTRNKIRLKLIPYIQSQFNSNFIETSVKNAENLCLDKEFIENIVEQKYNELVKNNKANISLLNREHISIQRRIIYKMIVNVVGTEDLSSGYVDDVYSLIIRNQSGKKIDLPGNSEAVIEYGVLWIREKVLELNEFQYSLEIGNKQYIPELGISINIVPCSFEEGMCFSSDDVSNICIRNRRKGDIFYPEGMNGRKKIKDYFIDEKIPRYMRSKIGIITCKNEIVYILGKRRDKRFSFKKNGYKIEIC